MNGDINITLEQVGEAITDLKGARAPEDCSAFEPVRKGLILNARINRHQLIWQRRVFVALLLLILAVFFNVKVPVGAVLSKLVGVPLDLVPSIEAREVAVSP